MGRRARGALATSVALHGSALVFGLAVGPRSESLPPATPVEIIVEDNVVAIEVLTEPSRTEPAGPTATLSSRRPSAGAGRLQRSPAPQPSRRDPPIEHAASGLLRMRGADPLRGTEPLRGDRRHSRLPPLTPPVPVMPSDDAAISGGSPGPGDVLSLSQPPTVPTRRTEARRTDDFAAAAGGGLVKDHARYQTRIARDGTVEFDDKGNLQVESPTRLSFDLTDAVMRRLGDDPYAAHKRRDLDKTRQERQIMAASARQEDLRESLLALPKNLQGLWQNPRLSTARKRELLFQLWDECAEAGTDAVVASGSSARATIVSFIRRRLPRESDDAFTPAELERLNRRRTSSMSFAPY